MNQTHNTIYILLITCCLSLFVLLGNLTSVQAQTTRDVASTPLKSPHISFVAGGFLPVADLNTRFGAFASVGASFGVKTKDNKYLGFRVTYLTGAESQEPGLLSNLLSPDGQIVDNEGDVANISVSGRGAIFGIHAGTIIPLGFSNVNSGVFLRGGLGSIHHKIGFDFTEHRITQLEDPYLSGYDRLSWGGYVSGFIGYWHMDTKRRLNAYGGIFSFASRTSPLRTTNFDTGISDTEPRFDAGLGFEFGWVLHIYKRDAKEYWY